MLTFTPRSGAHSTALRVTSEGLVAIAGTAAPAHLFVCRVGTRLTVSNILALALAAAGDDLVPSYPFYPQDLSSIRYGAHRYRPAVPTVRGQVPGSDVGRRRGKPPSLWSGQRKSRTARS